MRGRCRPDLPMSVSFPDAAAVRVTALLSTEFWNRWEVRSRLMMVWHDA
jgi:hypothetical protein